MFPRYVLNSLEGVLGEPDSRPFLVLSQSTVVLRKKVGTCAVIRKRGKFLKGEQVTPWAIDGLHDRPSLKFRDGVLFVPGGPALRPRITHVPRTAGVGLLEENGASTCGGRVMDCHRGPSEANPPANAAPRCGGGVGFFHLEDVLDGLGLFPGAWTAEQPGA